MAEKTIRVAIVGFGTVGSGVAKIILEDADYIEAKTGVRLELAKVVDVDLKSKRKVTLPKGILTDDLDSVLNDKTIQVGIELIGGTKIAKEVQLKMLASGKDVITANKALLAKCGSEIYAAARKAGRCIAFEASCAGGIPIISALRTGLAANRIQAFYGIVNGTCNYILSNMSKKNMAFAEALKQAQEKGYAEADPTLDINGGDTSHKLAILASLAFGYEISLDNISVEGIENVDIADIQYGKEMGYTLKLLAIGERAENGKIFLRVHPSFIPSESPLARIDGPFNAVNVFGHAVGGTLFYGRGAGMMPTASAVVADIIEVAIGNSARLFNHLQFEPAKKVAKYIGKAEQLTSRFYIKLKVVDKPGVFAQIGNILAKNQISISGILQHEDNNANGTVPAIVLTHPTEQKKITKALAAMSKLAAVKEKPVCIKIVDIPEDKD